VNHKSLSSVFLLTICFGLLATSDVKTLEFALWRAKALIGYCAGMEGSD
jgi:hypothetical protein